MEFLRWCRLQWDRVTAVLSAAVGGTLVLIGWVKVSGLAYTAQQIPVVVSCGFGGLALLGLGATLWRSAEMRDDWRKLDRLEERVDRLLLHLQDSAPPGAGGEDTPTGETPNHMFAGRRGK
jgi:hypothetical protein